MRRLIFVCCALLALVGCQVPIAPQWKKPASTSVTSWSTGWRTHATRSKPPRSSSRMRWALSQRGRGQGGDLEKRYDALNRQYEASVASARDVRARIDAVEDVANALFKEWESELKQYSNASLKAASAKLSRTRAEYRTLLQRMKAAEQRIEPVLQRTARSGAVSQAQPQCSRDQRPAWRVPHAARQCRPVDGGHAARHRRADTFIRRLRRTAERSGKRRSIPPLQPVKLFLQALQPTLTHLRIALQHFLGLQLLRHAPSYNVLTSARLTANGGPSISAWS